jgi:hypothetical protein
MLLYRGVAKDMVMSLKPGAVFEGSPIVSVKESGRIIVVATGDGNVFHVHRKGDVYSIFKKRRKNPEWN